MGNRYEVKVWCAQNEWVECDDIVFGYSEYWRGETFVAMLWNLIKAKLEGHGCVTLNWR